MPLWLQNTFVIAVLVAVVVFFLWRRRSLREKEARQFEALRERGGKKEYDWLGFQLVVLARDTVYSTKEREEWLNLLDVYLAIEQRLGLVPGKSLDKALQDSEDSLRRSRTQNQTVRNNIEGVRRARAMLRTWLQTNGMNGSGEGSQ